MPGQSSRKSKSSSRKFVTKSLTSVAGPVLSDCGLVFVLTAILRELPLLVVAVAVAAVEVDLDIIETCDTAYACVSGVECL